MNTVEISLWGMDMAGSMFGLAINGSVMVRVREKSELTEFITSYFMLIISERV